MSKQTMKKGSKQIATLKHDSAKRKNIPQAEDQSLAERIEENSPVKPVSYSRNTSKLKGETYERDIDFDPQIVWKGADLRLTNEQIKSLKSGKKVVLSETEVVWRGKDQQDWSDLIVQTPPIYVQENIHPKHIIMNLKSQTQAQMKDGAEDSDQYNLFSDFNGIHPEAKTEYYMHDKKWQNRMILGDSLQVMASLAEREKMRGDVQCIYFDPPYGIQFLSNWQVSTRSRNVKDGKVDQITREPEQVKAFRDTWKDGIHSYLTYLRDRLTVMRDLLTERGSIFVQIGDENVHRVRMLMDEIFGEENFFSQIQYRALSPLGSRGLSNVYDYILWYCKDKTQVKYKNILLDRPKTDKSKYTYFDDGTGNWEKSSNSPEGTNRKFKLSDLKSSGYTESCIYDFEFQGETIYSKGQKSWRTHSEGMERLIKSNRLIKSERGTISFRQYFDDASTRMLENTWTDTAGASSDPKTYVVQTNDKVIARCLLMTSDPGDLVLDPTCGSGTTATVAEKWGRRWITIDTSRVALALSRTRLMSSKYPYFMLADSHEGIKKEKEISGLIQINENPQLDICQGFVLKRVSKVTLGGISNNTEIDVIWEKWQKELEPLLADMNKNLDKNWKAWEVPREGKSDWPDSFTKWWETRLKLQEEINKSINEKAEIEYLYDRPYEDTSKVRVAGPFTVESLSPHRVVSSLESEKHDSQTNDVTNSNSTAFATQDFSKMVLENLTSAGVHQSSKEDRITFTAIEGWPGNYIAATGIYEQDMISRKAAIFIGPEFGTVTRAHIMAAAREAHEARFDVLIVCGFNFDAHSSEVNKLGPLPILKAKMNPDLHMADDLKNTGKGNLFVVFGEPDIKWEIDNNGEIVVEILGIDVFDPKTGEVRASDKEDIAVWFIDTEYDEESFFVRHAYFLGARDPYKKLKTSLKAEINQDAWATLYRDKSRPFQRPSSGRFAVKVINHFGDEVMKVFEIND